MIKNLSKNLRSLREKKNISQKALARMAGVSNDYANRIEKLKAGSVGLEIVSAFAKALKV
ncbi:MAG: helix-turn-helix domain-containing protein, partial [Deltaproteobacteria bacterium]|nr:helix-turn-helix domain-containing protein [Deltaproteobacteria bacterium]